MYIGTVIKTNHGRPFIYKVVEVQNKCTCPDPMDWYEGQRERRTRAHYHILLKQLRPIEAGMHIPAAIGWIEFRDGEWRSIFERFQNKIELRIIEQPK